MCAVASYQHGLVAEEGQLCKRPHPEAGVQKPCMARCSSNRASHINLQASCRWWQADIFSLDLSTPSRSLCSLTAEHGLTSPCGKGGRLQKTI